jgi:hypothetical protein
MGGAPTRDREGSVGRPPVVAAAVVGLALRFALNAPPCGLRRAPLRATPTTWEKPKIKPKTEIKDRTQDENQTTRIRDNNQNKKGTLLMR